MTPEETTQVAEAVDRAIRWLPSITAQINSEREFKAGTLDVDAVLTREWKRASRVMRSALKTAGPVAANSAVTQYMGVYNALVIVRREAGRKAPANHASSRTDR